MFTETCVILSSEDILELLTICLLCLYEVIVINLKLCDAKLTLDVLFVHDNQVVLHIRCLLLAQLEYLPIVIQCANI